MKDRWTCSGGYQRAYQTQEQVGDIIGVLQLDSATALIDIGCGNGAFALEAARRYPKCKVWACDPLESAVAECRKRAANLQQPNFEAFVASAESVPLPDNCADRILMRNVLHHVEDPEAAFAEICRLLKGGGRVVLEGPCNAWDEDTGKLLSEIHMLMDDSHQRTYVRPETIIAALEGHGLYTESVDAWTYPFRVNKEQTALIRERNAQEKLRLSKRDDGRWFIELRMVRVVTTKTLNSGRDRNGNKA